MVALETCLRRMCSTRAARAVINWETFNRTQVGPAPRVVLDISPEAREAEAAYRAGERRDRLGLSYVGGYGAEAARGASSNSSRTRLLP